MRSWNETKCLNFVAGRRKKMTKWGLMSEISENFEKENFIMTMAEEIERYRAKVSFQHKFENVKQLLDSGNDISFCDGILCISSPKFYARNIPFRLALMIHENEEICCVLICDGVKDKAYSLDVEYQFSLISPSKRVQSPEYSCTFDDEDHCDETILSEAFAGEKIIVDDATTIKVSLWLDEPAGASEYKPPKMKLRQDLEIVGNQAHASGFERLLDSGEFSDVTFIVVADSSSVKAHKTILAAQSDVFARMLTTDMKEAKDNEIRIDDMGSPTLKIMLRHIYTGKLEFPKGLKIDLKICQELVNAAEKYDLQNLKEYAAMAMTEFVSIENAWELLSFANQFKAKAAIKALGSYYVENVNKIIENP